ncbi:MAG: cytochrome c biogenesis protein CcsA [Bacteroidales bacterium]
MNWSDFIYFAIPAIVLWLIAGITVFFRKYKKWADISMIAGIVVFAVFIILFWIHLDRPPMRTMGETRLWYSFFLSAVGYGAYKRWSYPWLLSFSALMAAVFVIINLAKPEIHSKSLMPALQSVWFIPHVTSYILSYAMFGAATIGAIIQLSKQKRDEMIFDFIDNMIYIGYGFLMLGLLMGAIWAKEAWGHYWSWDPKETWAFVTSAAYLAYIHIRLKRAKSADTVALWFVPLAFILLMITWIGVNYLPSAQGSVHVY